MLMIARPIRSVGRSWSMAHPGGFYLTSILLLVLGFGCAGGRDQPTAQAQVNPGFSLAVSPSHLAVSAGESATVLLTVSRFNGLTGPIVVTGLDFPSGMTMVEVDSIASDSRRITLQVSASALPQTDAVIRLRGQSGQITSEAALIIDVAAGGAPPNPVLNPSTVQAPSARQSGGPYANQGVCLEQVPAITQTGANGTPVIRVGYLPGQP